MPPLHFGPDTLALAIGSVVTVAWALWRRARP